MGIRESFSFDCFQNSQMFVARVVRRLHPYTPGHPPFSHVLPCSGVVAMGAGISCGTAGGIATTLNQALQRGSVMSKVGSASWAALADGNYTYVANATQLLHDSLLYAPGVPSSSAMDAGASASATLALSHSATTVGQFWAST